MTVEKEIAQDAGTVRHRIVDVIEGLQEQLKDVTINEKSRAAIFPLVADGLMIATVLTLDQTRHPIPAKVMHQADLWLSHAAPLLEALKG